MIVTPKRCGRKWRNWNGN